MSAQENCGAPHTGCVARTGKKFADTSLISICRLSSEGWDRTSAPFDGDFYLSHEEALMVETIQTNFKHMVVVLNTGGIVDSSWFFKSEQISAVLPVWQSGIEGGAAMADILCGDDCPSGRLSDTFAIDSNADPSSSGFSDSPEYVEYRDDIYVGYRYFETIPYATGKVCYPFGFGLSYTTFSLHDMECRESNDGFAVKTTVTNTGQRAGKQVVQVYCQAPQGKLGKSQKVLVGFMKTKKLAPDKSQHLTIHFNADDFASYDDLGKVQASAWVLEAGEYRFWIGENVRDAQLLPLVWILTKDRIWRLYRSIRFPNGTCRMIPFCRPQGSNLPKTLPFLPCFFWDVRRSAVRLLRLILRLD